MCSNIPSANNTKLPKHFRTNARNRKAICFPATISYFHSIHNNTFTQIRISVSGERTKRLVPAVGVSHLARRWEMEREREGDARQNISKYIVSHATFLATVYTTRWQLNANLLRSKLLCKIMGNDSQIKHSFMSCEILCIHWAECFFTH